MLAVLAIIAVMTGLAVPSFVRLQQDARLRATVRSLLALCNYARSEAAVRQQEGRLILENDTRQYYLAFPPAVTPDTSGSGTTDNSAPAASGGSGAASGDASGFVPLMNSIAGPHTLLPDIKVALVMNESAVTNNDRDYVSFFSNGRADRAALIVSDPQGNEQVILIDPITGLAHVEKQLPEGWLSP